MASSIEFVEYAAGQVRGAGEITYRKMFGEFLVYCGGKPVILICDDTAYVKKLPCVEELMSGADEGEPYSGAKVHWILDIDDGEKATEAVRLIAANTPKAKKRGQE